MAPGGVTQWSGLHHSPAFLFLIIHLRIRFPRSGVAGFAGTLPRYPRAIFGALLQFVILLSSVPSEHSAGTEFPLPMSDPDGQFQASFPSGCLGSGRGQGLLDILPFSAPTPIKCLTYHLSTKPHLEVAFKDQPKTITLGLGSVV